ncbi:MAG: NAD(P)H-dependent oxidoreductase [Alphaproteobacteria bacterium]|nr:NAD(P)H-dependent oxidoreductase [Alphaproteobacteria bacterium]
MTTARPTSSSFASTPVKVRQGDTKSSYRPFIVGIGGTSRTGSSSEKALAISLKAAADGGAETLLIPGPELDLPMYNPSNSERTPAAQRMIETFRRCDGVIIASPAYHGSISGLVKNALDYAEDMRADQRIYLDGLPIGCIACAGGWQAAGQTLAALRAIAHALRGWPTPLGAMLNTSGRLFDESGACLDLSAKMQLETVGRQVLDFATKRQNTIMQG